VIKLSGFSGFKASIMNTAIPGPVAWIDAIAAIIVGSTLVYFGWTKMEGKKNQRQIIVCGGGAIAAGLVLLIFLLKRI
jgi:hypothetical protein